VENAGYDQQIDAMCTAATGCMGDDVKGICDSVLCLALHMDIAKPSNGKVLNINKWHPYSFVISS